MNINDISEEWKNQNQDIKQLCEAYPIWQLDQELKYKSPSSQFKILERMTQSNYHLEKLYQDPEHFVFNRTSSIMTFNPTRVLIGEETKRSQPQNYINANFIQIDCKKLIATQGPMKNTFFNFWRMIDQHNVQNIFMLCDLLEGKRQKCFPYWFKEKIPEIETNLKYMKVTLLSQNKTSQNLTIRSIKIQNLTKGTERILQHFQLFNWIDGDKPSQKIKIDLDYLINQSIKFLKNNSISVVHCSAGVGRTGTFIAMTDLRMQIQGKKNISIFETVRKLKEQRWGMVYTNTQYCFLYDFVNEEISKLPKNNTFYLIEDQN